MKRIHILPEYWSPEYIGACGWIRLLTPLLHPSFTEEYEVTYGYDINLKADVPDFLIIERLWHPMSVNIPEIMQLLETAKKQGTKIIYSIDDNLFEFPHAQNSAWFNTYHLSVLNLFLYYADNVVVSTSGLKEYLSAWNKNIVVIENAIEPSMIRKPKVQEPSVVIGYLASPDNLEYLFSILEEVHRVLGHFKNVYFEICGPVNPGYSTPHLNSGQIRFLAPPKTEYPSYQLWIREHCHWDLALAPMLMNDFTLCKSDMKFLDFTRLAVPGIYTDFIPYHTVFEQHAGISAGGNWTDAIISMIENPGLRNSIVENACQYISKERTLTRQIASWKTLLESV